MELIKNKTRMEETSSRGDPNVMKHDHPQENQRKKFKRSRETPLLEGKFALTSYFEKKDAIMEVDGIQHAARLASILGAQETNAIITRNFTGIAQVVDVASHLLTFAKIVADERWTKVPTIPEQLAAQSLINEKQAEVKELIFRSLSDTLSNRLAQPGFHYEETNEDDKEWLDDTLRQERIRIAILKASNAATPARIVRRLVTEIKTRGYHKDIIEQCKTLNFLDLFDDIVRDIVVNISSSSCIDINRSLETLQMRMSQSEVATLYTFHVLYLLRKRALCVEFQEFASQLTALIQTLQQKFIWLSETKHNDKSYTLLKFLRRFMTVESSQSTEELHRISNDFLQFNVGNDKIELLYKVVHGMSVDSNFELQELNEQTFTTAVEVIPKVLNEKIVDVLIYSLARRSRTHRPIDSNIPRRLLSLISVIGKDKHLEISHEKISRVLTLEEELKALDHLLGLESVGITSLNIKHMKTHVFSRLVIPLFAAIALRWAELYVLDVIHKSAIISTYTLMLQIATSISTRHASMRPRCVQLIEKMINTSEISEISDNSAMIQLQVKCYQALIYIACLGYASVPLNFILQLMPQMKSDIVKEIVEILDRNITGPITSPELAKGFAELLLCPNLYEIKSVDFTKVGKLSKTILESNLLESNLRNKLNEVKQRFH